MRLLNGYKKYSGYLRSNLKHMFIKPKHKIKRIVSLTLIIGIMASLIIAPVWAYESNVKKQEVVYVNLNSDGNVDGVYVVNIFDINEKGQIIDYGDYAALRNMTTNDEITFDKQTVKIDTDSKKLYYEGKLNSNVIPWIFDIKYYMNDVEYSAEDIAGMSGNLKINMNVRQNPDSDSTFFDNYTLQITFALNSNKSSNIVAEDSTKANVGKMRQIMYTILPGKEKDIVITAQVEDFEMDGISVNGLSMDMDFDIDVENNEDINELQDGVQKFDDGAHELNDGAKKLSDGAYDLVDGLTDLKEGVCELKDGADELQDGANVMYDGVQDLDEGANDLMDGADDLADGSKTLYDGASDLQDGVQSLYDGTKELDDGISKLTDGAKELRDGADDLADGASELNAGLGALTAKNSTLQEMSTILCNGTLWQYSSMLDAEGYKVNANTTAQELEALMERRKEELTGGSNQEQAIQEAVRARVTTLSAIAANVNGNHTVEEIAEAEAGINYWNMTMAIQGEQGYQTVLAAYGQEAADSSQYYNLHVAFSNYLAYYKDEATLSQAYASLSAQVGNKEQTAIGSIVEGELGGTVANDEVYKALAALSYYKGVIVYTGGVASAASGARSLYGGANKLYKGADELYDGAKNLGEGSKTMLDVIEQLLDGTAELKDGTLELHDGVLTIKDGVVTLKDGTQDLLDGVIDLQEGIVTLSDGIVTLLDGTVVLLDGAIELHDGSIKLHDGTVELVDGTIELKDKTTDANLKDIITKAIDEIMGSDFDPISFVSEKNKNVDFVQFVIKTPAISIDDVEVIQIAPVVQMNFWQKLLSLFGLYGK